MSCEKVMEMLSLYIDNELDEQESNEIEKHLRTCEECNREYEDLLAIKKLLSETPQVELPLGFKEELHKKLVECSTEDNNEVIDFKEESKKVRSKKRFNWKVLSGIAAGILLTVVSVSSLINNDFETKEYAKMESEKAAPQEAMPFNIAMEEAKNSDIATGEAPAQEYGEAKMDKAEMNFTAEDRGVENQKEKTTKNMKIAPEKMIISGYINLQVNDYDAIYNKIVNKVTSKGGFVQNSYTSYKDSKANDTQTSLKSGGIVLRIPKIEFENMFNDIKPMGTITDENIKSNEITTQYMDILATKDNLKLEEKKLREILDNTKNEKENSELEGELNRVLGEIERLSQQILRLDDLEALSTIEVYLDEIN